MVTKSEKFKTVDELKERLEKASAVYTTTQNGLSVEEITNLRDSIRDLDAEFKIAKNTLIRKASEGSDSAELFADLAGTSAFLFCYDDAVAPLAKVKEFTKENKDKLELTGGFLDGQVLDKEQAVKVADLPSKEVLLSQIAGLLMAAPQQIAGMLTSLPSDMAYILKELGEKPEQDKLLKDFISDAPAASDDNSENNEEKEG